MPEGAIIAIGVGLLGVFWGVLGGAYLQQRITQRRIAASERSAARILSEAERRHKELLFEAKEESLRLRQQTEAELRDRRKEAQRLERRLVQKEEGLDRKLESLEQRQRNLQGKESQLEEARAELQELDEQRKQELERVSSLTAGEAKELLLAQVEREIRDESNRLLRQIEQEVKEEADQRSRKILATAMQRLTGDVVSETTTSVVPLPSEDMKGRIIGREGRNIRALEHATGVDVIIDDTPDAVTLSGFDPVRREIARVALTKLLTDGRIHPARIEEMVEKARKEVDVAVKEAGEEAAVEAGCPGLHPEVIRTLGRLKYRYSYGQNQLNHAVETANLAAIIAHELGANVEVARRGGRPGARRESMDQYLKRLEALEAVANAFPGVEKSFAIQAGREIRIIVKPEEIDDLGANRMAKEISKKIEENLDYPGQIKVTVIRERRSVEYAK